MVNRSSYKHESILLTVQNKGLFILLTLMFFSLTPFSSSAQELNVFGGISFTGHEESGFPSIANNVEVILVRNNSLRGANFEPNFGAVLGFDYKISEKLRLNHSFEYTRILSTFASLDNDQNDPVLGSILTTGTFKQPFLNQQSQLSIHLFKLKDLKISLSGGIVTQILLKNRNNFDKIDGWDDQNRRAFDMLNSVPLSFKIMQLRYSYGLIAEYKSMSLGLSRQNYFNNSLTSQVTFEDQEIDFRTFRNFY